jgi:putative acyl-CoA dehydrogenase
LALYHAAHRRAFGARLIEQPLMQSVLADICIESEAATALALRLARAFDSETAAEVALRRVLTSAAKFWVCKRGIELAAEVMEVLGGNGYTEELPLARIFKEMPVNSIWEGSGNIMCLDVLRAFAKSSVTADALLAELCAARGLNAHYDAAFESLAAALQAPLEERDGRGLAQRVVTLVQAALLLKSTPHAGARAVAEGFCATRLNADARWGAVFGSSRVAGREHILSRAALKLA